MSFAASSHTEELDEPPGLPDRLKESFSGPIILKLGQRMNPEDAKYLKTEFGVTVHSRPIRKSRKTNVPDDLKDAVHELTLHGPPEKLDDAYQEAKRRLEENMENFEKESEEEKAAREAVKNQRLADHRKERERIKEEKRRRKVENQWLFHPQRPFHLLACSPNSFLLSGRCSKGSLLGHRLLQAFP